MEQRSLPGPRPAKPSAKLPRSANSQATPDYSLGLGTRLRQTSAKHFAISNVELP